MSRVEELLVLVLVMRVAAMVVVKETEVGDGNLSTSTLGFDGLPATGTTAVGETAYW